MSRSQYKLTSLSKQVLEIEVKQCSEKPRNTPEEQYPELPNLDYEIYQDVLDGADFPLVQMRTPVYYDDRKLRVRRKGHARM